MLYTKIEISKHVIHHIDQCINISSLPINSAIKQNETFPKPKGEVRPEAGLPKKKHS